MRMTRVACSPRTSAAGANVGAAEEGGVRSPNAEASVAISGAEGATKEAAVSEREEEDAAHDIVQPAPAFGNFQCIHGTLIMNVLPRPLSSLVCFTTLFRQSVWGLGAGVHA